MIYLANPRGRKRRVARGPGGRFLPRGAKKRRFSAKARAASLRNLAKARRRRSPAWKPVKRSHGRTYRPRIHRTISGRFYQVRGSRLGLKGHRVNPRRRRRNPVARVKHRRRRRFSAKARAAAIRNLRKARRSRKPRSTHRRRRRTRRPATSRRRRRSYASNPPRRRRRRRHYARNPMRRHRRRHSSRRPRSRRRSYRRNPGFAVGGLLPSFGQGTALVKTAGVAALGWVGTNGVMMLLDKIGVANLKAKITDPKMLAVANLVQRTISAYVASKLLSRVVKGDNAAQVLRAGAAANVGLHAAADVVQAFGVALPSWGAPLLLGYSGNGMGSYVTQATLARRVNPGMRGYITAGTSFRQNAGSMLNAGYASAFPVPTY